MKLIFIALFFSSAPMLLADEIVVDTGTESMEQPITGGKCSPSSASRQVYGNPCPPMSPGDTSGGECSFVYDCGRSSGCHPVGGQNPYIVTGTCHPPTKTRGPGTCVVPFNNAPATKSCIPN